MEKFKTLNRIVGLAGIFLLLFSPMATANVIIQTENFTSANEDLVFDYYSGGGTLQSVEIIFSFDVTGDAFSLTNNTGDSASGTADFVVTGVLTGVTGSGGNAPSLLEDGYAYFIGSGGDTLSAENAYPWSLANGASADFGEDDTYADSTNDLVAFVSQYVYSDTDTFTLNVDLDQDVDFQGTVVDSTIRPAKGYSGSVTVKYTDNLSNVPEPASMLLFGAGLIGLAGVSRKRLGLGKKA